VVVLEWGGTNERNSYHQEDIRFHGQSMNGIRPSAGLGVFASDDLILRQMAIKHYALGENTTPRELVGHAEKWAPYRGVASILLWRSLKQNLQNL
jgi:hypothetical protein